MLPSITSLKDEHKDSKIILLTTSPIKPFAEMMVVFDQIETLNIDRGLIPLFISALKAWWRLFKKDTAIDLEVHSRLSTIFALLFCSRNRLAFYTNHVHWKKRIATHLIFLNITSGIYYF